METLQHRLQKRIHVGIYAILFLAALLVLSVILEGYASGGKFNSAHRTTTIKL
jgi:hypothetical protein